MEDTGFEGSRSWKSVVLSERSAAAGRSRTARAGPRWRRAHRTQRSLQERLGHLRIDAKEANRPQLIETSNDLTPVVRSCDEHEVASIRSAQPSMST
jgi:hypothetical protein